MVGQQETPVEVTIQLDTEWDEFWSYVGKKKEQRWTWYAIERSQGRVLAWRNGRRKEEVLQTLIDRPCRLSYSCLPYGRLGCL